MHPHTTPQPSLFDLSSERYPSLLPDWLRARMIAEAVPVLKYDRGPGRQLRVSVVEAPDRSCWFADYSYALWSAPSGWASGGGGPPGLYRAETPEGAAHQVAAMLLERIPACGGDAAKMRAMLWGLVLKGDAQ